MELVLVGAALLMAVSLVSIYWYFRQKREHLRIMLDYDNKEKGEQR